MGRIETPGESFLSQVHNFDPPKSRGKVGEKSVVIALLHKYSLLYTLIHDWWPSHLSHLMTFAHKPSLSLLLLLILPSQHTNVQWSRFSSLFSFFFFFFFNVTWFPALILPSQFCPQFFFFFICLSTMSSLVSVFFFLQPKGLLISSPAETGMTFSTFLLFDFFIFFYFYSVLPRTFLLYIFFKFFFL